MAKEDVYLVEDDAVVRKGYEQALSLADIPVRSFTSAESFLQAIQYERPALVITDVRLPGQDGMTLLRQLRQIDRDMPVLLMTGHGDVALAVEAMREGAYDFIEKPFSPERLTTATRSALEKRVLLNEIRRLKEQLGESGVDRILGQTPSMHDLRQLISSLAPTGVDLLINGETGTGKEVVARAIHEASGRKGFFVPINCAALPEQIFESELFGYESGAFTGAAKRRVGRVEYSSGGTLFLDEIESMPLALQAKLLRVLQDRIIERLGSNDPIQVDLRLVAASKSDLKFESEAGRFRADLYYRLNVVSLDLPPLRKRRSDIPLLMAHFLSEAAQRYQRPMAEWIQGDLARWQAHDWPGNVRELRNVADRWALGLKDGLPNPEQKDFSEASLAAQLDSAEFEILTGMLRRTGGNVVAAAESLKTPRKTFYDKLTKHGIVPENFRR